MKNIHLGLLLLLASIVNISKAQECPCVKTPIIGNNPDESFIHNNSVVAMNDTAILAGSSVLLKTITCTGQPLWYRSGQKELLANYFVSPVVNTEYIVKSSLEECPDMYDTVTISIMPSGLSEIDDELVLIYPNPTSDELNIFLKESHFNGIEILDAKGKIIKLIDIPENISTYVLDIADIQNGIYILKLISGSNILYTKQILKN